MDDHTYTAAKRAASSKGMIFGRWLLQSIRFSLGMSDENLVVESAELSPLTEKSLAVREMTLETRLEASIKQADARKENQ